ncbi:PREDICTED: uncharacterized protein LOC106814162 [Priapulus caudatus]|uniref:Uncharacterized protein LOC106814162 n=1 Tax=Priapulus caudatus TaxID=37621 RepID=A0ABM1EP22_PRICU|nr:PREDICTED: uncharacterized protein LOC106814162 [Priapulus caudatus]
MDFDMDEYIDMIGTSVELNSRSYREGPKPLYKCFGRGKNRPLLENYAVPSISSLKRMKEKRLNKNGFHNNVDHLIANTVTPMTYWDEGEKSSYTSCEIEDALRPSTIPSVPKGGAKFIYKSKQPSKLAIRESHGISYVASATNQEKTPIIRDTEDIAQESGSIYQRTREAVEDATPGITHMIPGSCLPSNQYKRSQLEFDDFGIPTGIKRTHSQPAIFFEQRQRLLSENRTHSESDLVRCGKVQVPNITTTHGVSNWAASATVKTASLASTACVVDDTSCNRSVTSRGRKTEGAEKQRQVQLTDSNQDIPSIHPLDAASGRADHHGNGGEKHLEGSDVRATTTKDPKCYDAISEKASETVNGSNTAPGYSGGETWKSSDRDTTGESSLCVDENLAGATTNTGEPVELSKLTSGTKDGKNSLMTLSTLHDQGYNVLDYIDRLECVDNAAGHAPPMTLDSFIRPSGGKSKQKRKGKKKGGKTPSKATKTCEHSHVETDITDSIVKPKANSPPELDAANGFWEVFHDDRKTTTEHTHDPLHASAVVAPPVDTREDEQQEVGSQTQQFESLRGPCVMQIENVPSTVQDWEIEQLLEPFGSVLETRMLNTDDKVKVRVRFEEASIVEWAVSCLHESESPFPGCSLPFLCMAVE